MSRRKRRTRVARDSSRSSYEDGFPLSPGKAALNTSIDTGNGSDDVKRELSALRQEILKSHIVAERARGIENPAISNATRSLEEDLERLEKNVLGTSSDLDQDKF